MIVASIAGPVVDLIVVALVMAPRAQRREPTPGSEEETFEWILALPEIP